MIDRYKKAMELKKALNDLFFSLNSDFLDALQVYTKDLSDELKADGTIYNDYTLESLINKFSDKYFNGLSIKAIQELKNNDSISCQIEYYDLIEYMILEIDI